MLVGAVGGTAAACSPYELQTQRPRAPRPTASTAEVPAVDPDVALAARVLEATRDLLAQVDVTLERHPRLARVLESTRSVHAAHVALLEEAVPAGDAGLVAEQSDSTAPTSDPASPSPTPSTTPRAPRDPVRAVRKIARDEDALVLTAKQAAFAAQSGGFARVLASLAAAAAQQSAALRTARVPGAER